MANFADVNEGLARMPIGPRSMHQTASAARRMQHPLPKFERNQSHARMRQVMNERKSDGISGATFMDERTQEADAGLAIPYSATNIDAELKLLPAHLATAVEAAKSSRMNSLDIDSDDGDLDPDADSKAPLLRPLSIAEQRAAMASSASSRITASTLPPGRRLQGVSRGAPASELAARASDAAFESFLTQACAPPTPLLQGAAGPGAPPVGSRREMDKQQDCVKAASLYGLPAGLTTHGHTPGGLTVRGHAPTGAVLSSQISSHLSGPWAQFPLTVDSSSIQGRKGVQLPQAAWGPRTVGGALTGQGCLLPAAVGGLASSQTVATDSIRMLRGPRCGFVANGKGDDVKRQKLAYKATMILAGTYAGEVFKDTGKVGTGGAKRGRPRAEE